MFSEKYSWHILIIRRYQLYSFIHNLCITFRNIWWYCWGYRLLFGSNNTGIRYMRFKKKKLMIKLATLWKVLLKTVNHFKDICKGDKSLFCWIIYHICTWTMDMVNDFWKIVFHFMVWRNLKKIFYYCHG